MKEKGVERRKEKKKRKKEEEKKRKKKTLSLRSPAMRHVAQPLPMSFTAAVLTHHHHHHHHHPVTFPFAATVMMNAHGAGNISRAGQWEEAPVWNVQNGNVPNQPALWDTQK